MKYKILITLAVCVFTILGMGFVSNVSAVDNVTPSAGIWAFMQKDAVTKIGYSFTLGIPTGIDITKPDTTINADGTMIVTEKPIYSLIVEPAIFYSDFIVDKQIAEVEAECVSTINRKTLGLGDFFVDFGGTAWNFSNPAGENKTTVGYYAGGGGSVIGLSIKVGAHLIPDFKGPDLFVAGMNVGWGF